MSKVSISETDLNRLAQRFYEASGITLPRMADKPMIVDGLRAVFEAVEVRVQLTNPLVVLSAIPEPWMQEALHGAHAMCEPGGPCVSDNCWTTETRTSRRTEAVRVDLVRREADHARQKEEMPEWLS